VRTVEEIYAVHCKQKTAITAHLPRLRELAHGAEVAVEFGVKRGASSSAILLGAKLLISYDVAATPEAQELKVAAGERWSYRIADSRAATIPPCGLMFVDSLHTYDQVRAELAHSAMVWSGGYLVFHDVTTFGEVGALGESGCQSWTYRSAGGSVPLEHRGIRPAIDELMIRDPTWRIIERRVESHGLLVLQRQA
jgi:hypothetical protein